MNNEELTKQVIAIDERVTRHTEQIKTLFAQTEEMRSLTESVHKLASSCEILAYEQKTMSRKMDSLVRDVDELKEKPGKRWESVVGYALSALVGGVIAFLLVQLGLK